MSITTNNKILASDVSTALNNKQDKLNYTPVKSVNGTVADTAGNVAISVPATPKAYITDSWVSGTEWYRKWSNGWIEQGGITAQTSTVAYMTVTLHTAFSSTTSYAVVTGVIEPNGYDCFANLERQSATAIGVRTVSGDSSYRGKFAWYAFGY